MSERARALEQALRELTAMVRGECPSLLNEDSGGNGDLSYQIEKLLAVDPPPSGASPQATGGYIHHSLTDWIPTPECDCDRCTSARKSARKPTGGASPQAETSEDEDDAPAVDSWSAPLRKPVVPKILSTDDFYALLRIIEVLPVADPFLTDLQSKLSAEERRQHGNRASHLSGPEFVREIERIEALIQSRLPAPVSPASPQAETSANVRALTVHICDDCLNLRGEMCNEPGCRFCRRTMAEVAEYLDALLIRPRIDGVSVLIDEGTPLPSPVSPVEPTRGTELCVPVLYQQPTILDVLKMEQGKLAKHDYGAPTDPVFTVRRRPVEPTPEPET